MARSLVRAERPSPTKAMVPLVEAEIDIGMLSSSLFTVTINLTNTRYRGHAYGGPAPLPDSREDTDDEPGRGLATSTPRWVKVFGIVILVLVLLFVIVMFTSVRGHGPGRHTQSGDVGDDNLAYSITDAQTLADVTPVTIQRLRVATDGYDTPRP